MSESVQAVCGLLGGLIAAAVIGWVSWLIYQSAQENAEHTANEMRICVTQGFSYLMDIGCVK